MLSGALPILLTVILAVAVGIGAIAAVSQRDGRVAVLGLLVALLAAPFIADPLPDARGLAARLAGGVLVAYPLLMAIRGQGEATPGSRVGWPADALLAFVAAVVGGGAAAGWDVAGQLGGSTGGPGQSGDLSPVVGPFLPAVAAGSALLVLAAAPTAVSLDPIRLTIGLTLGILGLTLVQAGLSGPPTAFTDLTIALVMATVAAGGLAVSRASHRPTRARASTAGDARSRPAADARRSTPRPPRP